MPLSVARIGQMFAVLLLRGIAVRAPVGGRFELTEA